VGEERMTRREMLRMAKKLKEKYPYLEYYTYGDFSHSEIKSSGKRITCLEHSLNGLED